MTDYNEMRRVCQLDNSLSSTALDSFLMHYAARREKLPEEIIPLLNRFKHVISDMPSDWIPRIMAQLIAHRIFKSGGLIKKYLNHTALKDLAPEDYAYLQQQSLTPWRFSFSEIISQPAPDFFEMEDVFTGETYLLYSKSVTAILSEQQTLLWFNLISFNGHCWQTYGPVGSFPGFDADDVFFYATELDTSINSEAGVFKHIEQNPIPYLMLITGANAPLVMNGSHELVQVTGEQDSKPIDVPALKQHFQVEYAHGVFKLSHKDYSGPPHFAEAYYDETKEKISIVALTDAGYDKMTKLLNEQGFDLPAEPDLRVHLPMLSLVNTLLKKNINLIPHARLFEQTPSPTEADVVEKLNIVLQLATASINNGEKPDIAAIAAAADMPADVVSAAIIHMTDRVNKLKNRRGK